MKSRYIDFKLDSVEFTDPCGVRHKIIQAALPYRQELKENFIKIEKLLYSLPSHLTFDEVYETYRDFRELCNRCLELCGIELEWFAPFMIPYFFYWHEEDEAIYPGRLVQLNFPSYVESFGDREEIKEFLQIINMRNNPEKRTQETQELMTENR